ncbi:MAG: S-layer homology domain-containing protein [Thermaerobacterales bacterium]
MNGSSPWHGLDLARASVSIQPPFPHRADIPPWARPAVESAYAAGLVRGDSGTGRFAGNRTLSRAEPAVLLERTIVWLTDQDIFPANTSISGPNQWQSVIRRVACRLPEIERHFASLPLTS